MSSEFGTLLRQRRQRAGLTQEALAEHAGVGVRTIRGLETGERPDPRVTTVRLLADALDLRPHERDELLGVAVGQVVGPPAADPGPPGALAGAVEQLAHATAARWQREEEQRQVRDPFPLPVRWRAAAEELTDHWANIRQLPAGDPPTPLELAGRLDEIVDVHRRIPSGRLVLLGRSGSGKTILTLRFVLDYLASRARTDPVPVIFSVGSWNPTKITLRDWLARQLARDHPGLAATGPGGPSLAAALVDADRVLPVLDGFDEIAAGLRRPALEALNDTAMPLLLTSRPAEYADAVAETDVLTSAAAVELTDLTVADLAGYLPRTARKVDGAATAWDPVLAELRDHPRRRASVALTAVLTTPLMVTLARASYSDSPDRDPRELLDTERFTDREALEDHLLGGFVPAAYRRTPRRRFDPDRAQRWLGYLAHHLTRSGTPDLAWWQLGGGLHRTTRTLVTALVTGLAIGLLDVVLGLVLDTLQGPLVLARQFEDGITVAVLSGLMFGLAYWLTVGARNAMVRPSTVRPGLRRRTRAPRLRAGHRLIVGSVCGAGFGSAYGIAIGMSNGFTWIAWVIDALIFGVAFGVATGLSFGVLGALELPLDIGSAVNPRDLLRTNRATVLAWLLVWAPTFGVLVGGGVGLVVFLLRGALGPMIWTALMGVRLGVLSGLGGALGYSLALTAWGQWAVLARIWLPLTGRLPWATAAFLDDAYRRGVLRQAGPVYQFRHARLQQHLAHAVSSSRSPQDWKGAVKRR